MLDGLYMMVFKLPVFCKFLPIVMFHVFMSHSPEDLFNEDILITFLQTQRRFFKVVQRISTQIVDVFNSTFRFFFDRFKRVHHLTKVKGS